MHKKTSSRESLDRRAPSGRRSIWIDLDNSPHVPFFRPIIERLESDGYKTIVTARNCFQVQELAALHGIACKLIGKHYGKHLLLKMIGTFLRAAELLLYVARQKPALALSHGSRSQLVVCKVLGITSLIMDDYEHSEMHMRPDWLLVPEVVADCESRMDRSRLKTYPGIKEDVYVTNFTPESSRAQLGLSEHQIVAIVRPPADEAHYRTPETNVLYHCVMERLLANSDVQIILLPRTEKQAQFARAHWETPCKEGRITIPAKAVDALTLIWHSDLVISGGGTMNREAAALGVPVYSMFRGPTGAVDRGLEAEGRLVLLEGINDVESKVALQKRCSSYSVVHRNSRALDEIIRHITLIAETC